MSLAANFSAFCALVVNLVVPHGSAVRYRLVAEHAVKPVTIPRRRYRESGIGNSIFSATPYRPEALRPIGFALTA